MIVAKEIKLTQGKVALERLLEWIAEIGSGSARMI